MNNPLLPVFLKHCLFCSNFSLTEFANCHMWMELSVCFQLRNSIRNDFLDIQELIPICLRNKENSTMREEVHLSKDYIEGWELIEPLLKDIKCILKVRLVNKRKTNIDVRLPSLECRIINFS